MPTPKKKVSEDDEELNKGFHGIIKAMNKMVDLKKELKPKFAEAKKAIKDAYADVLKGDASSLDEDDASGTPAPPPAESNTGTPEANTPPPTTAS